MVLDFGCIFAPSPPPRDRATEHNGNGLEAETDGAHVNLYVEMETGNEFWQLLLWNIIVVFFFAVCLSISSGCLPE